MLFDLLDYDNYSVYNIKLAKILGLSASVYCTHLLNIQNKANIKHKLNENGFFKIDRKYIYEKTSLLQEQQFLIDADLLKMNIICRDKDNLDLLKINEETIYSLIAGDIVDTNNYIDSILKTKNKKVVKETQKQAIINNLKNSIECSNYELLTALRGWIDSIYNGPKPYLSKAAVKAFQNRINEYTKIDNTNECDLDLALRLVEIASIRCLRDANWAINVYEQDKKLQKTIMKTPQKNVENIGVGEEVY